MNYKFNNSIPIYMQVVDLIKNRIISGEYPMGSQLYSIRAFANEFGINPNTMQRVFIELENEKFIYTKRTIGKFVTDDEELIKKERETSIIQIINKFIIKLEHLGLSKEEILTKLKENLKGDE